MKYRVVYSKSLREYAVQCASKTFRGMFSKDKYLGSKWNTFSTRYETYEEAANLRDAFIKDDGGGKPKPDWVEFKPKADA